MRKAALLAFVLAGPAFGAEVLKLRPTAILYADAAGVALNEPQGVGCGAGVFVVADSANGRVLKVEISGALVRTTAMFTVKEIAYPVRADLAKDGTLFVLDGKSRRIGKIKADGTFGGWVPAEGAITGFALAPSGNLYALDLSEHRVVVLDGAGATTRTIALPADARFPVDVAVGSHEAVFVVDAVTKRLYGARAEDKEFAPLGKPLTEDLDFPGALASDGGTRLFVADQDGGGIVILGTDGSFRGRQAAFGWKEGYLRWPSGLCVSGKTVVVADRENQRVEVFSAGE
jgi:DNA-binding beta-propeller fold protein YncE